MATHFPNQPNNQPLSQEYNPYNTPTADMQEWEEYGDYHTEPFYSRHGRIGRIRFLSYSLLMNLVVAIYFMILGIIAAISASVLGDATIFSILLGLGWFVGLIGQLYAYFVPSIRRLNDLDKTGWLSLLFFIPIINLLLLLYLIFAPGDDGYNSYGTPAEPPTTLHYVLALAIPLLFIGIIFAVAIPAYQEYVMRAQLGL